MFVDKDNSCYHHYRSLIKQVYDGDVETDVDDLADEVHKAYEDNKLTGQQYDSLCDLICDL